MKRTTGAGEATISYTTYGSGPPLVLVHGSFSDHDTNWQEAKPLLADIFCVVAVARRGRGESSATTGHSIADEGEDVAAVLREIGEPAYVLGHSHGALCALEATALYPAGVSKLVLYEPPGPRMVTPKKVVRLEELGTRHDWDGVVRTFMLEALEIPPDEVNEISATPFWDVWTEDGQATLHDLKALASYDYDVSRFRRLALPVQFLIGTESPRDLFLTDALAAVLPNTRINELAGQAHEGMTTDPARFVDAIATFLLAEALAA